MKYLEDESHFYQGKYESEIFSKLDSVGEGVGNQNLTQVPSNNSESHNSQVIVKDLYVLF